MIFVTVGTELPFDRLVKTINTWAKQNREQEVFAQIGEGAWEPDGIKSSPFLAPAEFSNLCSQASVIVAHAGMGTILSALSAGKPLLVMPRLAKLGEHRNEHQSATARHMHEQGKVNVAFDETELLQNLDSLSDLALGPRIGSFASEDLIKKVRTFISS